MTLNAILLRSAAILGLAAAPVAALAQQAEDTAPGAATEMTEPDAMQSEAPEMPAPETAQTDEAAPATEYDDETLSKFLTAAFSVNEVRDTYVERIQSAASDADREEIAREANREMSEAVEAVEGIDVETYNEISMAAQSDQELNARIMAMAREVMPSAQNEG